MDAQAGLADARVLLDRLADDGAQIEHETLPRHLEQVQAGFAVGVFEKRAGVTAELQHSRCWLTMTPAGA